MVTQFFGEGSLPPPPFPPAFAPGLQFLDLTLPTIAANLALDEAFVLAAEEPEGRPVLRLWEPDALAVVLGSSGRLLDDVHAENCRADGVAIARRSSGGGTVVVGPGALNVTVVLHNDLAPGLGAVDVAQAFVLDRLAAAIRALGPPVEVLGLGDLTLDRRKFSGSAQRRLRRAFLVHATILYDFPIARVARYTALPRRQPAYRAGRPHDDFLVNLPLPRAALVEAVRSAWLPPDRPPEVATVPEARVAALLRTRFADPAWIGRL